MTGLLVTEPFRRRYGAALNATIRDGGLAVETIVLPEDAWLDEAALARVDAAFFSGDQLGVPGGRFFRAVDAAPNLRWLHVFHAGLESPRYAEILERGVRISNSSGSHAEPIAQTVIGAMLWFARDFPRWQRAQRERRWDRKTRDGAPRDLRGQTMVVVGLGAIGNHVARIASCLGLHVIGMRRSPAREGDVVDEVRHPRELHATLPEADWLVLACPLTAETRGLIDARALSLLKPSARLLNVARGAVVVEDDLIEALRAGALAGAYLDVFEQEPLPEDSPLWDLPNVIISPHNSAMSDGNDDRATQIFLDNLGRWCRDEPLVNEATEL